jgi:hypothetical protein
MISLSSWTTGTLATISSPVVFSKSCSVPYPEISLAASPDVWFSYKLFTHRSTALWHLQSHLAASHVYQPAYEWQLRIPVATRSEIHVRYRLCDIDVPVNRTLAHGSLTITLVALFFGNVAAHANSPNALPGNVLNNHRLQARYDVTSVFPRDVLRVVPEKLLQRVTWVTKP